MLKPWIQAQPRLVEVAAGRAPADPMADPVGDPVGGDSPREPGPAASADP